MKQIYFMRHGESEFNAAGIWAGQANTPLTPVGHAQATKAGKLARQEGLVFDQIISSPLSRAHDTAKHIARELGYPLEDILLHDLFMERSFGELEGTVDNSDEIREQYKSNPKVLDTIPGAEPIDDFYKRTHAAYQHVQSLPGDKILIVAHGGIGRALRSHLSGNKEYEHGERFPNAEIFRLV